MHFGSRIDQLRKRNSAISGRLGAQNQARSERHAEEGAKKKERKRVPAGSMRWYAARFTDWVEDAGELRVKCVEMLSRIG